MAFSSPGIILRTIDYGESDRIVSIFTATHGKVSAFVPGARRSKKRFAQALDLFCKVEGKFTSRKGSSMMQLTDFRFLDVGLRKRMDLARIILACSMIEAVERLSAEFDAQPEVYLLLDAFLTELESENILRLDSANLSVAIFRLLNIAGLMPELNLCVKTGLQVSKAPTTTKFAIAPLEGGLLAASHLGANHSLPLLSIGAVKTLTQVLQPGNLRNKLRFNRQDALDLTRTACGLIEFHAGREMKSKRLHSLLFSLLT